MFRALSRGERTAVLPDAAALPHSRPIRMILRGTLGRKLHKRTPLPSTEIIKLELKRPINNASGRRRFQVLDLDPGSRRPRIDKAHPASLTGIRRIVCDLARGILGWTSWRLCQSIGQT